MSLRYSRIESPARIWKRPIRALTLIWAVATVVLAATGPFGSFSLGNFATRLVYWASVVAFSIALSVSLRLFLAHLLGQRRHPFLMDALMLPLFTLFYTPPLFYLNERVSNLEQPFTLWQTGLVVLAVSVSMVVLREVLGLSALGPLPQSQLANLLAGQGADEDADPAVDAPAPAPDLPTDGDGPRMPETLAGDSDREQSAPVPLLLQRLPEDKRGAVHALSGADHYVEVHTEHGLSSILLRFADALRELDDWPGLRIHRSHWVADSAVDRVRVERGRLFVVLRCGRELPVSRTYVDAVRDRWGGSVP